MNLLTNTFLVLFFLQIYGVPSIPDIKIRDRLGNIRDGCALDDDMEVVCVNVTLYEEQIAKSRDKSLTFYESFRPKDQIYDKLQEYVDDPDYPIEMNILPELTYEGQQIRMYTLQKKQKASLTHVQICTQHAREWISPMSCVMIIEKILKEDQSLLDTWNFHIVPIVNPDGYDYTWDVYYLWRKNRRPCTSNEIGGSGNIGVDLNRNWGPSLEDGLGGDWSYGGSQYASPSCSEDTYRGPYASSEQEVIAIQNFLKDKPVHSFFDVHSYGSWIFSGLGTDYQVETNKYDPKLTDWWPAVRQNMISTLYDIYGWTYQEWTLYGISGGANNYFASPIEAGGKGALQSGFEMRGNSFQPPTSYIYPGSIEVYVGMKTWLSEVEKFVDICLDGDVNSDEEVNILDVVQLISYIIGKGNTSIECADANQDNTIDILDVVGIINIIINSSQD